MKFVLGKASALSPSLMLEALRTTNRLFEHDPYARDLFLAGVRPLIRRRSSSSSSFEPLQKKLKVSVENHTGLQTLTGLLVYIEKF